MNDTANTQSGARYARASNMPLSHAIRLFIGEFSARYLIGGALGLLALRLWTGGWSIWDLIAAVGVIVLQPFVEWLIHVYVLHARPFSLLGMRFDFHAARHHRLHHKDPWDLRYTVMPRPIMFVGSAVMIGAFWLALPTFGSFLTALFVSSLAAIGYEWVHYLIHTSVRPRTRWFTHLWRMHRLHHFKNEHYWMGVSRTFGDVVLGTNPEPSAVPSSQTARTLGRDDTPTVHDT